jgi:hypothetical protein
MKKPQVRKPGSFTTAILPRITSKDELNAVTGGDGVTPTRVPQLQETPSPYTLYHL